VSSWPVGGTPLGILWGGLRYRYALSSPRNRVQNPIKTKQNPIETRQKTKQKTHQTQTQTTKKLPKQRNASMHIIKYQNRRRHIVCSFNPNRNLEKDSFFCTTELLPTISGPPPRNGTQKKARALLHNVEEEATALPTEYILNGIHIMGAHFRAV